MEKPKPFISKQKIESVDYKSPDSSRERTLEKEYRHRTEFRDKLKGGEKMKKPNDYFSNKLIQILEKMNKPVVLEDIYKIAQKACYSGGKKSANLNKLLVQWGLSPLSWKNYYRKAGLPIGKKRIYPRINTQFRYYDETSRLRTIPFSFSPTRSQNSYMRRKLFAYFLGKLQKVYDYYERQDENDAV